MIKTKIECNNTVATAYDGKSAFKYLPVVVQQAAGLRTVVGHYLEANDHSTHLGWQNDQGKTFDQIADLIESRPTGLFEETV